MFSLPTWRLLLVASVILTSTANAQSLWTLAPAKRQAVANLTTPASLGQPVSLSGQTLATLKTGDTLDFDLPNGRHYQALLRTETVFANGDRSLIGHLVAWPDYSIVLTLGAERVFARVNTPEGSYSLSADQQSGLLAASQDLQSLINTQVSDTLAPKYPQPRVSRPRSISRSGLTLDQSFTSQKLVVGQAINGTISITNTTASSQTGVKAILYFVVEKTDFVSATSGCTLMTNGQKRLECTIGTLAAGATRTFNYSLLTTNASHGSLDAAVIVTSATDTSGSLREDDFIDVLYDTTTDTDADGVSDFNESLQGTNPALKTSVNTDKTVIDLMAVYTAGAANLYAGDPLTRLQHLVSVTNNIYEQSGVAIRMRLVNSLQVNYSDTASPNEALTAITGTTPPTGKNAAFSQIDALREQYGADLVVLFRPYLNDGSCGLAWTNAIDRLGDLSESYMKDYGYSHVAIDCDDYVLSHETGHNMGLGHSHRQNDSGTFDYSVGYGIDANFVTIMAYASAFNNAPKINKFSSPLLSCNAVPCGIAKGNVQPADAVSSLNTVRLQVANFMATKVAEPVAHKIRQDYNGDGKSDLWVRNRINGENYLFELNGTQIQSESQPLTIPLQWLLTGTGDVNNDNKTDLIWRNQTTGENVVLFMQGKTVIKELYLPQVSDQNWQIVAIGDYNGDQSADIAWRNKLTGENVLWLLTANGLKQEVEIYQVADLNWQVLAAADFDGDGKDDLFWGNKLSREHYVFLSRANMSVEVLPVLTVPANWQMAAVGDLNGDAKADIFWRNTVTGENEIHFMDGNNRLGVGGFSSIAPAWSIATTGDYNADGKTDLTWFNATNGESYLFLMDGAKLLQESRFSQWNSNEWRLVP